MIFFHPRITQHTIRLFFGYAVEQNPVAVFCELGSCANFSLRSLISETNRTKKEGVVNEIIGLERNIFQTSNTGLGYQSPLESAAKSS